MGASQAKGVCCCSSSAEDISASMQKQIMNSLPKTQPKSAGPQQEFWKLRGQFAAFLCYFRTEAFKEANTLKKELESLLGAHVFMDDLHGVGDQKDKLMQSDVLIFIQTQNVLTRPWCLMELATAIMNNVPIVAVRAESSQYPFDFQAAIEYLEVLDISLEASNPGAATVLEENGFDKETCAYQIGSVLPMLTSVTFDAAGSRDAIRASATEIVEAMEHAVPVAPTESQEEWAENRQTTRWVSEQGKEFWVFKECYIAVPG